MHGVTVRDAWAEPDDDGEIVYRTAIDAPGVYVGLDLGRLSDDAADTVDGLRAALAAAAEQGKVDGIASATDADIARAFVRRFRPARVLLGCLDGRTTYADGGDGGEPWLSGVSLVGGFVAARSENAAHAAGEDGFAAAVVRARQLAGRGA